MIHAVLAESRQNGEGFGHSGFHKFPLGVHSFTKTSDHSFGSQKLEITSLVRFQNQKSNRVGANIDGSDFLHSTLNRKSFFAVQSKQQIKSKSREQQVGTPCGQNRIKGSPAAQGYTDGVQE